MTSSYKRHINPDHSPTLYSVLHRDKKKHPSGYLWMLFALLGSKCTSNFTMGIIIGIILSGSGIKSRPNIWREPQTKKLKIGKKRRNGVKQIADDEFDDEPIDDDKDEDTDEGDYYEPEDD